MKERLSFGNLPVCVISSFGHNGLDWMHSLLDSHPQVILMPGFSFFRTLDFFELEYGTRLETFDDPIKAAKDLTSFLFTNKIYQPVRRKFIIDNEQAKLFETSLSSFLLESIEKNRYHNYQYIQDKHQT